MDSRTIARIVVVVVFIICAVLLVQAFQAMQVGNNGPLIQFVVTALLGGLLAWFVSRRRPGGAG